MPPANYIRDAYVGITENDYKLIKEVGAGRIGSVYRAERPDPKDTLACKIVPASELKQGWEREIQKLSQLRGVPDIVQYHFHGTFLDKSHRPCTYVFFDFIAGINLKQYMERLPWALDMAFVEDVFSTLLRVLLACKAVGISHGDLHPGNIMISDPDARLLGNPKRVLVADFGYGGSHNGLEPKDDYRQLVSITASLLQLLKPSDLNARDRTMHSNLAAFLRKKVSESDPTQGKYVGNPELLLNEFTALRIAAQKEAAAAIAGQPSKDPGDYLSAEMLGFRKEEWKDLFVPGFLGVQELLSRNITVLTGARGCGKTMAFRRLTVFMDKLIGEESGVLGSDRFVGFYLNCRDLSDAFPWLPLILYPLSQQQIMHYFHLSWMAEICKTIAIAESSQDASYRWLEDFIQANFGQSYSPLPKGASILLHVQAFLENEKEGCRRASFGRRSGSSVWSLATIDFLDRVQVLLEANLPWVGDKPLYMFLDDYTIPTVSRQVQSVLNTVVFKRRSKIFFKVSTEAANSFERTGLNNKPLELHEDFQLIDLASESLHQDDRDKAYLLDQIFRPRIDRHPLFRGKNFGLEDVLGKTTSSNNELAKQIRDAVGGTGHRKIIYHGTTAFAGMWASDIRIMIQMFAEMIRESREVLQNGSFAIDKKIQDDCYRTQGGEFLTFAQSVTNPSLWEKKLHQEPNRSYGKHLSDIVEAFIQVSKYELTKAPLIKNEERQNPKQAFRLEIRDKFNLPQEAMDYYEGLTRWHIFLQDWRGKSIRGMITPRLYINRVLIPFANLTFSSHDSISLNNEEFSDLLLNPKDFPKYWEKKRMGTIAEKGSQEKLDIFNCGE